MINLTLTITNKECNKDDQSFWQKLKEAVTDNPFFNLFIYLFFIYFTMCSSDTIMCTIKSLVSGSEGANVLPWEFHAASKPPI